MARDQSTRILPDRCCFDLEHASYPRTCSSFDGSCPSNTTELPPRPNLAQCRDANRTWATRWPIDHIRNAVVFHPSDLYTVWYSIGRWFSDCWIGSARWIGSNCGKYRTCNCNRTASRTSWNPFQWGLLRWSTCDIPFGRFDDCKLPERSVPNHRELGRSGGRRCNVGDSLWSSDLLARETCDGSCFTTSPSAAGPTSYKQPAKWCGA